MNKIVIIGGGGHAKVIISIIKKTSNYSILGYTDFEDRGELLGVKYLGSDNDFLKTNNKKVIFAALGVGQIKKSNLRRKLRDSYAKHGFDFPSIISPSAIINEKVSIGKGTVVMDGVIINSCSKIGAFSIINTGAIIEHDCKIKDFVHVAPGAVLSGNVSIGSNTLIGTGAKVIQNISICENAIIGAGSSVIKNILNQGIYFGVPAKKIK